MLRHPFSRLFVARWPRILADVGFCGGFVVLFALMVSDVGTSGLSLSSQAVELSLTPGSQRQGLYRGNSRLGTLSWQIRRQQPGWRVTQTMWFGGGHAAVRGDGGTAAPSVRVKLGLRRDLSLERLELDADLSRLARLPSLSRLALPAVGKLGDLRIRLRGDCQMETGDCRLLGTVGGRAVDHIVTAGRGPVLTSTIYPLLARGSLGGTAEVRIFDPMTLRQRVVTFSVDGREKLRLRSGKIFSAIRVQRDLEGLATRVWIDNRGRVLREELPLGLVVEHEAWQRPRRQR